jgi:hypothetical protein
MGIANPNELIVSTIGDKTFKSCRQCAAHLRYTIARLKRLFPNAHFHIIQTSFNDDISASAGTHDKCSCFDIEIFGLSWPQQQWFVRNCGWAGWWRQPWQGFSNHIHMCSITCRAPKGEFVPAQVMDYYNHTYGLAGMHNTDQDKSWFPGDEGDPPWPVGNPIQWRRDINETLFDYEKEIEEADMTPEQEDRLVKRVKEAILDEVIDTEEGTDITVRMAAKRAAQTPDLVRANRNILDSLKTSVATIKTNVAAIKKKLGA